MSAFSCRDFHFAVEYEGELSAETQRGRRGVGGLQS